MQKYKPYDEYKETDLPWLAKIPEHWQIIRSGYLFQEVVDTGHPELELLSIMMNKGIIKQSDTGRKTRASEDRSLYKRIKPGQLGYNLMNAFSGALGISKYDGILSPAYAVSKPILPMNSWFYQYLYMTPLYKTIFDWYSYGIMFERNRLYFDNFKRIPAPYPSVEEQNKIVDFIKFKEKQIKQFIKNKKKLIKLLNEQKQAIINQAVTKGLDPNVTLKNSGVDWLGYIPEHWEVRRLRTVSKVRLSGVDKHTIEGETPVELCNYVDVYKNDYISSDIAFMSASATEDEISKFELKAGDVIITKDSESWDDIAVPTCVPENLPNVICAYHLGLLRPEINKLMGEYLFRAFEAESVATQFKIAATGVTRFGLSQNAIKGALIPMPPFEEQQAIVNYIKEKSNEIYSAISQINKEIDLIQEYRTRLISDVVTGKIDVRDIPVDETDIEITDIIDEELENLEESENVEEEGLEVEYA